MAFYCDELLILAAYSFIAKADKLACKQSGRGFCHAFRSRKRFSWFCGKLATLLAEAPAARPECAVLAAFCGCKIANAWSYSLSVLFNYRARQDQRCHDKMLASKKNRQSEGVVIVDS